MPVPLVVNTAFGLEAVVAREVQGLGYGPTTVSDGKIEFAAELDAVPRLNLFLRAADRVRIRVARFVALDFGELFDQTTPVPVARRCHAPRGWHELSRRSGDSQG
jgi:putative N6-adenine-specific DNA methylase